MSARRSIGLGAALTACIGLAACKEKEAAPEPIRPVLSMVVRPIMTGDDAVVGTVEPRIKTEFSFR
ncbi:MAG: efflux transporter, family, subunit, partial [Tardiphaga sp.]|nr:efflux transporter, family, subunit [Tardiphaga sp.]